MSSWPLISDFARMLQNPQLGFRSPELKQCRVELNQLGQPKARSGNFATVYRGYRPDNGEFAIRVFNRRQDQRIEHYRTISEYLEGRSVSSIVPFEYDERGIRSAGDGKMYPLLIMQWVPGITLFEWVRDRSREHYKEALLIAADVWLHLVRELAEHQIVHGDLQHGNVMVSPEGHFKLVDYDCMCVPSLIGRRNLEIGMVPYQHPGRHGDTVMFPGMDNFSALVIYVALRALAAVPQLWKTYIDEPEHDKILFRASDFENPQASPLYRDLMGSPDEQVRDLTHYLFELYRYDLHDVPPVDEVLLWCESIDNLVGQQEWDKVVQLVQRMGPGEQVSPDMQPYVQEAQQRVACRQAMEEALARGDETRAQQLFATGLLNNYPAAGHLLNQARNAAAVAPVLKILESAYQMKAHETLKNTWLANQHLLAGRASTKRYQAEAQKLIAIDRVRNLLASPNFDAHDLRETWDYLEKLGGHALAEPFRTEVEARLSRRESLARLQQLLANAPPSPTLAFDKQIAAACKPEHVRGVDKRAAIYAQYMAAASRLKLVRKVHELEKKGTLESESFIASVIQKLPNSYHEGLARRSQQARRRLHAFQELTRAVEEPADERRIVVAWKKLGELRGRVLASDELKQRVELAAARVSLLKQLDSIPESADDREQERRVLEIWDEATLGGCADAAAWQPIYNRAKTVQSTLDQIRAAHEAEDHATVVRLLEQPWMHDRELPSDVKTAAEKSRAKARQAVAAKRQAIITTLLDNQRQTFADLFDAKLVAEICEQARHHQPLVSQWVESEILPLKKIGLSIDPEHALSRDEDQNLRIVWNWPPPHVANECRVVIAAKRPAPGTVPDDVEALYRTVVTRDDWDPAVGLTMVFDPEWHGATVFVWAVIDLGFQVFFSDPLHVGQIEPAQKQQRSWSLFGGWGKSNEAEEDSDTDDSSEDHGAVAE